jgi:hypothetical protein
MVSKEKSSKYHIYRPNLLNKKKWQIQKYLETCRIYVKQIPIIKMYRYLQFKFQPISVKKVVLMATLKRH